jgi:single-strand DNA-binding protein
MSSLNVWVGTGNLTRDPEVKYLQNGTAVANVSVGLNRKYGENEEVSFIDLTFFGKSAEIIGEHGRKGGQIGIQGRLKQDTWEKDGKNFSKLGVVVDSFQFLGKKSDTGGEQSAPKSTRRSNSSAPAPDTTQEIPF